MNVVTSSNGQILELDNMAQEFTYNDDQILETSTVVFQGVNYTITATIVDLLITGWSQWEPEEVALLRDTKRTRRILAEKKANGLR